MRFNPEYIDDIRLPLNIYEDILNSYFYKEAPRSLDENDKGIIRFAKQIIFFTITGDEIMWSFRERNGKVLDVLDRYGLLPFDLTDDYNEMFRLARNNGDEKIKKILQDAFNQPEVKKSMKDLTSTLKKLTKNLKNQEEYKNVNKELTRYIDLNSINHIIKYNDFIKKS
jgi:hypothetical protein